MKNNIIRYLLAILLIIIGVALVLTNIGVIDYNFTELWHFVYPILFILIGLKWLFDYVRRRRGILFFGLIFVIFGSLLLLGQFQIIDFVFFDVYKLWPLLIIYIGFIIIRRPNQRPRIFGNKKYPKEDRIYNEKGTFHGFTIGEHKFNKENWKAEPMDIKNGIGDYFIDFSKAYIPEKEIPININNWAGNIQVLLPKNIAFRVDASVKAGEINIMEESSEGINRQVIFETKDYETSIRKLNLHLKMSAGSIRVDEI